jgi:hypothetical protein
MRMQAVLEKVQIPQWHVFDDRTGMEQSSMGSFRLRSLHMSKLSFKVGAELDACPTPARQLPCTSAKRLTSRATHQPRFSCQVQTSSLHSLQHGRAIYQLFSFLSLYTHPHSYLAVAYPAPALSSLSIDHRSPSGCSVGGSQQAITTKMATQQGGQKPQIQPCRYKTGRWTHYSPL